MAFEKLKELSEMNNYSTPSRGSYFKNKNQKDVDEYRAYNEKRAERAERAQQAKQAKKAKFSEILWHKDKWLPISSSMRTEFYEIKSVKKLADFFETHSDEDALFKRFDFDGDWVALAQAELRDRKEGDEEMDSKLLHHVIKLSKGDTFEAHDAFTAICDMGEPETIDEGDFLEIDHQEDDMIFFKSTGNSKICSADFETFINNTVKAL